MNITSSRRVVFLFIIILLSLGSSKSQNEKTVLDSLIISTVRKALTSNDFTQIFIAVQMAEKIDLNKFIDELDKINDPTSRYFLAEKGDVSSLDFMEDYLLQQPYPSYFLASPTLCFQLTKNHRMKYFNKMKTRIPFLYWKESPPSDKINIGISTCIATGFVNPQLAQDELLRAINAMNDYYTDWYGECLVEEFYRIFKFTDDSILLTQFSYVEPLLLKFLDLSKKEKRALAGALLLRFNNTQGIGLIEDYFESCINNNKTINEDILFLFCKYRPQLAMSYLRVMLDNKIQKHVAMKGWEIIKEVPDDFLEDLKSRICKYKDVTKDSYSAMNAASSENEMSEYAIKMLFKHRYSPYLSTLKINPKDELEIILYYGNAVMMLSNNIVESDKPILKLFAKLPYSYKDDAVERFNIVVFNANLGLLKLGDRDAYLFFIKLFKDNRRWLINKKSDMWLKLIDTRKIVDALY